MAHAEAFASLRLKLVRGASDAGSEVGGVAERPRRTWLTLPIRAGARRHGFALAGDAHGVTSAEAAACFILPLACSARLAFRGIFCGREVALGARFARIAADECAGAAGAAEARRCAAAALAI